MGRAPCYENMGMKKGPWTRDQDVILLDYNKKNGLRRCGKSGRLRWTNYLRPDIKREPFAAEEERTVIQPHATLGNRWVVIASQLPGRTHNDIKNFWNAHVKNKMILKAIDPSAHANRSSSSVHTTQWENARLCTISALSPSSNKMTGIDNGEAVCKEPTDVFLKLWNSEAGKAFRNETDINISKRRDNNSESPNASDPDEEHAFLWGDLTTSQLFFSPLPSFNSDNLNFDQLEGVIHNQDHSAIALQSFSSDFENENKEMSESNNSTTAENSNSYELAHDHAYHNHYNNTVYNNSYHDRNNISCMMTEVSTCF